MWVKATIYLALVDKAARAETRADWLMTRVNQLELELGHVRHDLTGKPQPVPMFKKEGTPPPQDGTVDSFEDLGDELARVHGVSWADAPTLVKA